MRARYYTLGGKEGGRALKFFWVAWNMSCACLVVVK